MASEKPCISRYVVGGKPNYYCEWRNCEFEVDCYVRFYTHVSNHVSDLWVGTDEETNAEAYFCLWIACGFSCPDSRIMVQHVKYHAYHSSLKALGAVSTFTRNLPVCSFSEEDRNLVPSQEEPLVCLWEGCTGKISKGIQEHFNHISSCHVNDLDKRAESFPCGWQDCKSCPSTKKLLIVHIRMHTKQKLVACPNCGQMFAGTTKFVDHCHRQSVGDYLYECSICRTCYPTENLLKEHVRQHVHHYKCSFCDMTCSTRATLSTHIRYRHLKDSPFKCSICKYSCKTAGDLKSHLRIHDQNDAFKCGEKGCTFSSRTNTSLNRHVRKVHMEGRVLVYACHLCTKHYATGQAMTAHLMKAHNVTKPPGYSRFTYRIDDDCYYRLQTTRLESQEVAEYLELMKKTNTEDMPQVNSQTDPEYVTIDVMDEKGNIIKTESVTIQHAVVPPEAKIFAVGGEADT